jgi:hypothetical protein
MQRDCRFRTRCRRGRERSAMASRIAGVVLKNEIAELNSISTTIMAVLGRTTRKRTNS